MRLSRKVGLVIAFIAIAAVLGWMGSTYLQTTAEYSALRERHQTAQARLPGLIAEKAELENEESQAKATLDTSKAKFAAVIESIEFDEGMCATARAANVRILRITASQPSGRSVGGVDYSVARFTVVVSGDIGNILDFIHALRTGAEFEFPWSAEVTGLNIDYASGRADMGIEVYSYGG